MKPDEDEEKICLFLFPLEAQCDCHFESLVLSVTASNVFLLHSTAVYATENSDALMCPINNQLFPTPTSSKTGSVFVLSPFHKSSFMISPHVCLCWLVCVTCSPQCTHLISSTPTSSLLVLSVCLLQQPCATSFHTVCVCVCLCVCEQVVCLFSLC